MAHGPFTLDDFLGPLPPPGAVVGIGVDVAEVERVSRAAAGRGFVRQVFAPEEGRAWAGEGWDPPALAAAFALKEAFFKALGTGQRLNMLFHEIAAPPFAPAGSLTIRGRTAEVAEALGVRTILAGTSVSLGVALGWVVLTG